ncbi:MAG: HD domain-containing protein [Chloroflexi bacterium]|nr:HD domain-containing protein [Chloroflexota bacterium]MCL5275749.1 HD domain-containing protein [Chloroflexota bacterium]
MQTKAPQPVTLLKGISTLALIEAYFEFNQLKQLYRQGWLRRGAPPERCESVAEHTFSAAVLAMLIADGHFPALDKLKVLRLALLHDFGEIYAGDIVPDDHIDAATKHRREQEAVQQVLGKLSHGEAYLSLWQEYEAGASVEARFVKQIDRLEMAMQAVVYERQHVVDAGQFMESASLIISDPPLPAILEALERLRGARD